MAYVKQTLAEWVVANPDYNKYAGTTSGMPLIYQAKEGTPDLTPEKWFVWDWVTSTPDLSQAPAESDVSPTGVVVRRTIPTVPDAPSASDLTVYLGQDTDLAIDSCEGIDTDYQTARAAGQTFYLANFLGLGKKSQIYAASVAWSGTLNEVEFPEPQETTLTITPNSGVYNKSQVIDAEVSG